MASPTSNVKFIALNVYVAALGTGKTRFVACPVDGYVRMIQYASDVAVDGDNIITSAIAGTAITGGGFTLTTANAVAGMIVTAVPTAANRVLRGQAIAVTTDGGGDAGDGLFTLLIEQD